MLRRRQSNWRNWAINGCFLASGLMIGNKFGGEGASETPVQENAAVERNVDQVSSSLVSAGQNDDAEDVGEWRPVTQSDSVESMADTRPVSTAKPILDGEVQEPILNEAVREGIEADKRPIIERDSQVAQKPSAAMTEDSNSMDSDSSAVDSDSGTTGSSTVDSSTVDSNAADSATENLASTELAGYCAKCVDFGVNKEDAWKRAEEYFGDVSYDDFSSQFNEAAANSVKEAQQQAARTQVASMPAKESADSNPTPDASENADMLDSMASDLERLQSALQELKAKEKLRQQVTTPERAARAVQPVRQTAPPTAQKTDPRQTAPRTAQAASDRPVFIPQPRVNRTSTPRTSTPRRSYVPRTYVPSNRRYVPTQRYRTP